MPIPGIDHRKLRTPDGAELDYQVRGDGPAVVLANGLGGTYTTWRHQYAQLGERYRVICWDYRGLFRSGPPEDDRSYSVEIQSDDLGRILDAEAIDSAVLVGWSMGVQLAFEHFRRHRHQVRGIVALDGAAGRPFDALGGFRHLLPLGLDVMKRAAPLVRVGVRAASRWSGLVPLLRQIGLVAPSLDEEVFTDLAAEYAGLDFAAYAETLLLLGEHDAREVLGEIDVPVLIVAGSRDLLTPVSTAQAIRDSIKGAELVVVEGGTHYAAVEFPEQVNAHLQRFLDRAIRPRP